MTIDLFKLQDGKIVLTEICYTAKTLKDVMEAFKEEKDYMKVFTFLFYLYCPHPTKNPYVNVPEHEKEELLIRECEIDFSLDEPAFDAAKVYCEKLYLTPTRRFYLDCKVGLEKQGDYLRTTKITTGRDGNDTTYLATLKSVGAINDQFAKVEKAYEAELQAAVRGGGQKSFDE